MQTIAPPKTIQRPKVALISCSVPPSATGQATVLGHLFAISTKEQSLFLTDDMGTERPRTVELPIASYAKLPEPDLDRSKKEATFKSRLKSTVHLLSQIKKRAEIIMSHLKTFKPDVVVVCSASRLDIPATFYACFRLGIPFVVYMFDDPVSQWPPGRFRKLASIFESMWAKSAAGFIAQMEPLADTFFQREGRKPIVIHNPVSPKSFGQKADWPLDQKRPVRLVYTGSLYGAQADAVRNLLRVLDELAGQYELHIYTPQPFELLDSLKLISHYAIRHEYVEGDRIFEIQQQADILFLPLAFQADMRHVLVTASPQKMGEYLASGRPILAHVPEDTFVSQFFKKHQCGVVVNDSSGNDLKSALTKICNDSNARVEMTRRATALAAAEFSIENSQNQFWQILADAALTKKR